MLINSQSKNMDNSNSMKKEKLEYFKVFDILFDANKIVEISDKNGINLTNYVKDCTITKTEDSKIYLDNGYIIFYDNYGFKYICQEHYKETGKFNFGYDAILYYDRKLNNLIDINISGIYELSPDIDIKIINEIKQDEHLMKIYKNVYPEDSDLKNFKYNYVSSQKDLLFNRYDKKIYRFFKFYEGKEDEFEKNLVFQCI